jgi:hypothetical protein
VICITTTCLPGELKYRFGFKRREDDMKTLIKFATLLLLTVLSASLWADSDNSAGADKARGWHDRDARNSEHQSRSEGRAARRAARQEQLSERLGTDVCDPLFGGTPGLFGMCLAYCKAGELEAVLLERSVEAQKLERLAARKDKVLSYYNSRRQASDPEMPCIQQSACPCWGEDYTSAGFWTARGATQCDDMSADAVVFKSISAGQSDNTVNIRAYSNAGVGPHFCSLSDQVTGEFSLQHVSETDARFCGQQISATCSVLP